MGGQFTMEVEGPYITYTHTFPNGNKVYSIEMCYDEILCRKSIKEFERMIRNYNPFADEGKKITVHRPAGYRGGGKNDLS